MFFNNYDGSKHKARDSHLYETFSFDTIKSFEFIISIYSSPHLFSNSE